MWTHLAVANVNWLIPSYRSKQNKYLNQCVGLDSAAFSLSPLEACRVCSSPTPNFSPSERKLQVKHFRLTTVLGARLAPECSCAARAAPSAAQRLQGLDPRSEPFVRERSGGPQTRNEHKLTRTSTCSSHLEEAARTGESPSAGDATVTSSGEMVEQQSPFCFNNSFR